MSGNGGAGDADVRVTWEGDRILAAFEKAGYIGLAFYESGARSFYAKRPIHAAIDDPRPVFVEPPSVRSAARALERTLDSLAAWLQPALTR